MTGHRYRFVWAIMALAIGTLAFGFAFADEAAQAPTPPWYADPSFELPIGPTPWEEAHEKDFQFIYPPTDDPPPAPVCNPAEWEPMTGVLIRYPFGLPMSLIAEMSQDVEVKTIVSGTSQMNTVLSQFASGGVNLNNATFLIAPSNSMWTRDYGPWYIFTGQDVQGITDHIYNRPTRPDDNMIPWVLGDTLNIPVYGMPLIHTGGNYMSDGMGIAMSTNLVYNENPSLTPAQVDNYIYQYTGNDYMVVPDILTYGIHHIDCWAKMLDPGRIIVKRLSPINTQLEANVAFWQSQVSSYDKPYEIIRVDCYSSTPYTNSLILNDKVFVPLFNSSLDPAAMQTYQQAMPGYEILGYTGSWVSDDAIHCRVMGMTDRYMLRIVHVPLFDQINTGQGYLVSARVHAYSNMPLVPGTPEVLWKLSGGSYTPLPMTHVAGDSFTAYIPQQAVNSTVYYYIHAADDSNRSENHPYIGPGNPHNFHVLAPGAEDITLTPVNPPIIIPANGGSFNFNGVIANNSTMTLSCYVWIMVRLPNGTVTGPVLGPVPLTLAAGGQITRLRTQSVPGSAPAGQYTYTGFVGIYPSAPLDSSYFNFTKSSTDNGGPWVGEMSNTGEPFVSPVTASASLLTQYSLAQNYPNPFNPLTTIGFFLPQTALVKMAVYDIQGRQIATLVDGVRQAGMQEVTWDATGLPSGIYFYRLEAEGFSDVKKMMLVK